MSVNHIGTFPYWSTVEHHFLEQPNSEEDKAKLFYQHMYLVNNVKQPPYPYDHPVENISVKPEFYNLKVNENLQKPKPPDTPEDSEKLGEKLRPFRCPHCGKSFHLKHHLTTHERTHTGERPHSCKFCGKSFTHKYCLNTHLLLHSNERPYECVECKKSFTLKHHLMSHKKVHKRDKPFICDKCGKGFPLRKQLKTHEKFHLGERPFVCKECGDAFAQENHLVMHLRFHGSINSFVCKECGACFTRKFELVNHGRFHGKEPLTCSVCGKEFLQKRTLQAHLNTHKPCYCNKCGRNFESNEQLLTHESLEHRNSDPTPPTAVNKINYIPNGDKPQKALHVCDICFKKFRSKHGLTQHKKSQHEDNVKAFACNICNQTFLQNNHLVLHQRQHGNFDSSSQK